MRTAGVTALLDATLVAAALGPLVRRWWIRPSTTTI